MGAIYKIEGELRFKQGVSHEDIREAFSEFDEVASWFGENQYQDEENDGSYTCKFYLSDEMPYGTDSEVIGTLQEMIPLLESVSLKVSENGEKKKYVLKNDEIVEHFGVTNRQESEKSNQVPYDQVLAILTSYVCNDADAAGPGYVREAWESAGGDEESAKALGLEWIYC